MQVVLQFYHNLKEIYRHVTFYVSATSQYISCTAINNKFQNKYHQNAYFFHFSRTRSLRLHVGYDEN